jgi:outer membrane protein W
MNDLKSTGDMSWTYQPMADGVCRFNAKAGSGKRASTCSDEVNVTREKAACGIDVTVDPETYLMSIQATGVKGEFEFAGMTLPDGSTAQIDAFENVGDRQWTYDASETLPKKPGDYTYKFNGTAAHRGSDVTCDKIVVITRSAPEYRWIVRGYGAWVNPTGSRSEAEGAIASPTASATATEEEVTQIWHKNGTGFGFDIEFLVTPNIGLEATALFAQTETHFMYDNPNVWLMDQQDTDFGMFTLGANYHFTPTSRVDFFAGAFVAFTSYDTARFSFDDPDQEFDYDFDDDTGFGLNAGVDIPFKVGSPWIFTAGLNYVITSADDKNSPIDADADPWIGTLGIGYRF